jgi:hypothetical protein
MMNRRAFLGVMIGGIAAGAAVRTWPFRVFSFPTEIQIAEPDFIVQPLYDFFMVASNMPRSSPLFTIPFRGTMVRAEQ